MGSQVIEFADAPAVLKAPLVCYNLNMHITRKLLGWTALAALTATVVIRLVAVFSIQDLYTCSTADCDALSSAGTKIDIAVALQYVSLAIFAVSLLAFLYLWVKKKERI